MHTTLSLLVVLSIALALQGLKIRDLAQCPIQIESLGCWGDRRHNRALPNLIATGRDSSSDAFVMPAIQWDKFNYWLSNFICECAKKILKRKNVDSDIIGIQYYAECWGDISNKIADEYKKHKESSACVTGDYSPFKANDVNRCEVHSGKSDSQFMYRVSKYHRTCPEIEGDYSINGATVKIKNSNALSFTGMSGGDAILLEGDYYNGCKASGMYLGAIAEFNYNLESCMFNVKGKDGKIIVSAKKQGCVPSMACPYFQNMGCWKDLEPRKDPRMEVYVFNDRDRSNAGFSGTMLDWNLWDKGYLPEMLCRCAKAAKKQNKKYFGIQYYAECWITNDLPRATSTGNSTLCVDDKFNSCDMSKKLCKPQLCAGVEQTNQIYMVEQGPMMCSSSPCPANEQCITKGDSKYECVSK